MFYHNFVILVQQPLNQNGRNAKHLYGPDPLYAPHAPHVYDLTGVIHSIRMYIAKKSISLAIRSNRYNTYIC